VIENDVFLLSENKALDLYNSELALDSSIIKNLRKKKEKSEGYVKKDLSHFTSIIDKKFKPGKTAYIANEVMVICAINANHVEIGKSLRQLFGQPILMKAKGKVGKYYFLDIL
jgi:hypothetical protein